MKHLYLTVLIGLCLGVSFSSCNEDDLTPSEDNHMMTFPQGDADYDKEILAIYNEYGTHMIYDFNDNQFRWEVTSQLPYMSEKGDTAYVSDAVYFIQKNCLELYDKDLVKELLPYRIFLASNISKIWNYSGYAADWSWVEEHDTIPGVGAINGYKSIGFGFTSKRLNELDADSLAIVKAELNAALIASSVDNGLIEIPEEFDELSAANIENVWYANFIDAYSGYNSVGLLEYTDAQTITVADDFNQFVKYLMMLTDEEFDSRFLSSSFDASGRIAQKKPIVKNWLKEKYGIDIEEIVNKPILLKSKSE